MRLFNSVSRALSLSVHHGNGFYILIRLRIVLVALCSRTVIPCGKEDKGVLEYRVELRKGRM